MEMILFCITMLEKLDMQITLTCASGDITGLTRPPAFLDPSLTEDIILQNGVNYASGGGGILNETGSLFVSCNHLQFILLV